MLPRLHALSLKLALVSGSLLLFPFAAHGQKLFVQQEAQHDVSPPLSELAKNPPSQPVGPAEADELKSIPLPPGFKPASQPDTALQKTMVAGAPVVLSPTTNLDFDGIGQGVFGFSVQVAPPDTNGAVGKTQYVQWVNLNFAVFDKATGNILPNFPVPGNTLWTGFGGGCETDNDGDPIVSYDKLADRWVLSQLVVRSQPFMQCIAVSTTSDATGTYNRYAFTYPNLDDYPKMGVWPDAYYETFNMFGNNGFVGADACAYDRNAMLNGAAASQICFQQASTVGSLLPADLDGHVLPPAGEPNFMMDFGVNSLNLYKFHVDFGTPANSTFTGPISIPVTAFTPFLCNGGASNCVPQPGTTNLLDSLGDRLMYRLAYRNFVDHESLVVNHAVVADPVNLNSGVRWYEIQDPNGTNGGPKVAQQSTFSPDSSFRWMGSIAMDASGDVAVGYSVASANLAPSIAFAGRIPTDPVNTLEPETTITTGVGSQTNALSRWGDYSAMQVDPVDDCTFWYTTEYLKNSGSFNWNTRIANFKFPGCGVPDLAIAKTHSGNFTQGQTGAAYTITVTNAGGKDTDGTTTVTVTDTLPTGLSATAISGTNWTCTLGTLTCTRSDVLAHGQSYDPITLTVSVAANATAALTNSVTVSGGGDQNPSNNTATDPTTVIMTGPDPAIAKSHSGPFVQGQSGTYTIVVKNAGLSATNGTVTVTDALPTGLTATNIAGPNWTCTLGNLTCTRGDALASNATYDPITVTVNVANNAPARVTNTATVAGGGDTNPLNNNASDPTSVIPPPADLTITKSHTGNFNQGQASAAYTLTVSNVGSGPTVGAVTVKDTLPAGLTAASMFGNGWSCNFTTTTCSRNDVLAVNGSYPPISFSVNVADNAAASVINTATVSGGGEVNTSNDTASDPTTINPAPDLTITKSHSPDPMIVGQTGTYTLTVNNIGNGATNAAVSVNDSLPFGLTATAIAGTGWACSTPPTSFVGCTRSDVLNSAASYPPISITVSVTGGGPSVTNSAFVSGGGEFNTTNNSASDLTKITAPVLTITKAHTPDPFTVGQPGTYTINVSNTGLVATVGAVNVTDNLPFGLVATAVSGTGWSCSALPTSFLTCTRSDALAPNASYPTLGITVAVNNATSTVTNFASVTGGGDSLFHSASDTANVITPTLAITKSHTGSFTVGQNETYTINVSNVGKVATVGTVTLNDFLPFGMTAIATGGTGWSCSGLPTTFLTCTRADSLATNASYPSLSILVNVSGGSQSTVNTASVTGGGDGLSHSASDPTNVNAPSLSITKTHTGDPFIVGKTGTYTITVNNTGNISTNGNVAVQDFMPSGLTAVAVAGTGWSCGSLPTTFLNCSRGDALAPGAAYPPLAVTVSVTGGTPAVTNSASVNGGGDPNFHSASDFTHINGPLLNITKTHAGDPFSIGQTGTYTITVDNKAGTTATAGTVTVQDSLPFGLTATTVSGSGWNCSPLPTTSLTCSRSDSLAQGGTYPALSVTVSVNGGSPSTFNSATVTGGGDSSSHFASDLTNIIGPTLAITKTHTGDPFIVGQTGTYTITVDNKAGKTPTGGTVTVQDSLPSGLVATAVSGSGWNCSALPTSFLNCTRSDSLAIGAAYPALQITVSVSGGGPSVVNFANVNGGGDPFSHSASDTTHITGPVLAVAESHSPDPFAVGQTGAYTVTVSNTGTIATAGAVNVQDSLPQGLTLNSFSGSGWGCSGTTFVTCTRSDSLAANSSYPPLVLTVNLGNAVSPVINPVNVTGGGDSQSHSATDTVNVTKPVLAITKSHIGNFTVGQPGNYTITVSNASSVATFGTVTLTDQLPFGMIAIAVSGDGWGCSGLPTSFSLTCTRSDTLAANSSYPNLVVTAVANGATVNATNSASVTGGGDGVIHSASDPTTILAPTLAVAASHTGNFAVGQTGVYTITVSNPGTVASSGAVTVSDSLPSTLTATLLSGAGWTCNSQPFFLNCTRSDSLAGGGSYPPISLTVSVGSGAPSAVTNQVTLSGGGDPASHTASDLTSITLPDLAITMAHTGDFSFGQPAAYTITASNVGAIPTAGGTLIVDDILPVGVTASGATGTGWSCSILPGPQTEMNCTTSAGIVAPGTSLPPITLNVNVAQQASSSITNTVSMLGIGESNFANNFASDPTHITGLRFVPVRPCRVADTRGANGPFGGPFLSGGSTRGFAIPNGGCGIPASAQAYSVNVTVVPRGSLGFLTMFPCGQSVPITSTLNSLDGRIKAAGAILPAGAGGAVCAFVTNDTDLIIDINGYFGPATNPAALAFFPLTPCRLVDTRGVTGPLGGPALAAQATRTFPLLSSACNVPSSAQAYSLNYTAVPPGAINFLETWPAGQQVPGVSTLNVPTGTVTANAAIVPAGNNGDVSVFVTDPTDLVIDIDGYFAPPAAGGLSLFTVSPCRVIDTRGPQPTGGQPFSGRLDVSVQGSNCATSPPAQAYVLNATVVPSGFLNFLTLWPQGAPQPVASTLNARDGFITSNMAIVPTTNGSVSSFALNPTHLILDLSGFFAP
jgi:uncharacterized repeat protein (TIGR01451 family)